MFRYLDGAMGEEGLEYPEKAAGIQEIVMKRFSYRGYTCYLAAIYWFAEGLILDWIIPLSEEETRAYGQQVQRSVGRDDYGRNEPPWTIIAPDISFDDDFEPSGGGSASARCYFAWQGEDEGEETESFRPFFADYVDIVNERTSFAHTEQRLHGSRDEMERIKDFGSLNLQFHAESERHRIGQRLQPPLDGSELVVDFQHPLSRETYRLRLWMDERVDVQELAKHQLRELGKRYSDTEIPDELNSMWAQFPPCVYQFAYITEPALPEGERLDLSDITPTPLQNRSGEHTRGAAAVGIIGGADSAAYIFIGADPERDDRAHSFFSQPRWEWPESIELRIDGISVPAWPEEELTLGIERYPSAALDALFANDADPA